MLPLFDMMLRAQNGTGMDAMASQFNLAQEQVTKAMAALMPAFSSGFKRNTANPYDFSALIGAMASGGYAKYFEDMSKAFTPQGIADGNQVLEKLFGSKEVSRAVAAQAAQLTGIGQEVLKQMLPVMADTIMGGLFKQTTGQMGDSNPFAGTPMAAMMQQWLESTGFQPKPAPKQPNIFDNPFTKAFQDMMGGAQKPQAQAANPFFDNPFAKAFQDMMRTSYGNQGAAAAAKEEPSKPEAEAAPAAKVTELVNAMFDSGLVVQKSYQKSMEQIFDSYLSANGQKAQPAPTPDAPPEEPKA
ncbi:DUF937 domain-containing protein [Ciceribacter naphthalenivorans]|uniref:DUF937 domain-containing protein n=2 Tax=Alphaproteobacteria TaxID=28211 RepID=A0A512HI80_9HYPH|nr:DUF937 domain-containing protein [Ciceribacter naphthalenivorans]GEO85155.1 hypothetical protein RNA01_20870 [Ciceribacter naphthalenivorans]GLR24511.1 hypothetical protein GCM10007920_43050 [Ciceribacter naphthalenivorans]GLT07367.1 hypothetical protein GCM10007926_43050 [Sphingomonas psychrolutea]